MSDGNVEINTIPMYRKNSEVDQIIIKNTHRILEWYPECKKVFYEGISDYENAFALKKTIQEVFEGCVDFEKMSVYDFIVRFVHAPKEARKYYKRYLMGELNEPGCVFTLKDLIYDISKNPTSIDGQIARGDVRTVTEYFYGKETGERGEKKETTGLINRLRKWNFDIEQYPDNEFRCKVLYMLYDYEKAEKVHLGHYFSTPSLENVDNALRDKPTRNGDITRYFKTEISKEVSINLLQTFLNKRLWKIQKPLKSCIDLCSKIANLSSCCQKEKLRQLKELRKSLVDIYKLMPDIGDDCGRSPKKDKEILADFHTRLELHELEGREQDIVDVYNDIYISGVDYRQVAYIPETVGLPVKIPLAQVKEGLTQLGYDWSNTENLWALIDDTNVRNISFILGSNALYQENLAELAQRMVKCANSDDAITEMLNYVESLKQIYSETIKICDVEDYVKEHGNELFQEMVCAHNVDSGIKKELKRKFKSLSQYVTTYVTAKRFANADRRKDIFKHELVQDLREMLFLKASAIDNPFYGYDTAERKATLTAQINKDTIYSREFFEKNAYAFVEISRIRNAEMLQNLEMFKVARACENEIDKILLKLYSYGDLLVSENIATQINLLVGAACETRYVALLEALNLSGKFTSDETYTYYTGANNNGWRFGWRTELDMYLIYGIIGWENTHPYPVILRKDLKNGLIQEAEVLQTEEKDITLLLSTKPKIMAVLRINTKTKTILITDYTIDILTM